jgi:membrane-bound lytic murein transglycosylase MltF
LHSAKAKNSIFLVFFSFFLFSGCEKAKEPQPFSILDDILKTGEITVITRNNANCYYLYHDQEMGFEYDLGIQQAEDLAGRYVHIRRGTSYQKRLEELKEQGIDLMCCTMICPLKN